MLKLIKKYLLIFLMLSVIGNIVAFFMNPYFLKTPILLLYNCAYSILIGFPIMKGNELVLVYISKKIEWKDSPLKKFFVSLFAMIVVSSGIAITLHYLVMLITGKGFMFAFSDSALDVLLFQVLILVYVFTLFTGIEFFKMWKQGLLKQEALQRKAVELQLEAIKNQVNPHFLFNSLNSLSSLVYIDQDQAVEFIEKLSNIYRYVLEQKNKKTIEWKYEKQFLENYLQLMKVRFADNLNYEIHVNEDDIFKVVPLAAQILIENAIKHNSISDEKPLYIELYREEGYLVIRNNLQPKKILEISHNIGLENINSQYELLTKKSVIKSDEDGFFTVKLPVIN